MKNNNTNTQSALTYENGLKLLKDGYAIIIMNHNGAQHLCVSQPTASGETNCASNPAAARQQYVRKKISLRGVIFRGNQPIYRELAINRQRCKFAKVIKTDGDLMKHFGLTAQEAEAA